jgi:hypothetical protein
VVERQVQPKTSLNGPEEAHAALRPVASDRHQPDCVIVGCQFLPFPSETQTENAARGSLRMSEHVVRHLVGDHERQFVIVAGKPHHACRNDHAVAIRPRVTIIGPDKRDFASAAQFSGEL